jgi:cyclopropane fatty-acyl-phospholipid synthase-like methyltransferase
MDRRLAQPMRHDWDERAKENTFYYIATSLETLDEKPFFESGEREYQQLREPVLRECGFDPTGKTILEVGCGAGRMTSRSTASPLGFDAKLTGRSWRGPALDASDVSQTISAAGASIVHMKDEGTPSAWAWGTKL